MSTGNLLAAARLKATTRNLTKFSDLTDTFPSTTAKKERYLRSLAKNPNPFADAVANDPKMRFIAINNNILSVIHSIVLWHDNVTASTNYVGIIGDDLTGTTRVVLAHQAFNRCTIALTTNETAATHGFPTLETLPTNCSKKVGVGVDPVNLTHTCLGFTSDAYPNGPAFVVVPTLFPLAPGDKFNLEGHNLSQPLPATASTLDPTLLAWLQLIGRTILTNGTACNSPTSTKFIHSDWEPPANPEESDDDNDDVPAHTIVTTMGDRLTDTFDTPAVVAYPFHP